MTPEEQAAPDTTSEATQQPPAESHDVSTPEAPSAPIASNEAGAPGGSGTAIADVPTPSVAETLRQMNADTDQTASSEPESADASVPAETPTPEPVVAQTTQPPEPSASAAADATAQDGPTTVADQTPAETEVVPETPGAEAPQLTAEVPSPPQAPAEPTEPETSEQQTDQLHTTDKPSDRIREKLKVNAGDKPVGSEDIRAQRPEIPTDVEPVEIPETDDINADLEAEISAAMDGNVMAPVTTPSAPVETFGDAASSDAAAATAPTPPVEEEIGPGSKVRGTVQHIHGDDVFLNAGLRADVVLSLKQFPEGKQPSVGDTLDAVVDTVDDDGLLRARLPQAKTKSGGNWDALSVGQVVDCQVTGTNKGGLQITVSNIKGFLPASQVDLGYVSDLEQYVGQKLTVEITEVKPKKRNLVVSRRALLQAERESAQEDFWSSLEVGQDYTGTVKTLKNYGAFVNLGPIDGFLHVGEISWSRINHPNEVLKEGQEIQVRILKVDTEKKRISLGMKQLVQNPWQGLSDRYPSERVVSGRVTRVADFGAFVELEPGVEGLVHISELAWRRVGSVGEVLNVGDQREFKVLEVDQKRKRVSLSLKALEQRPESARRPEPQEESRPPRRSNPDLRGGMGGGKGNGGLFGNPSDFS